MNESQKHGAVHTVTLKSGRRTYFFDLRETRGSDLYLTLTESTKLLNRDGEVHYKKHKIFLYKEDIADFRQALDEAIDKLEEFKNSGEYPGALTEYDRSKNGTFEESLDFEDL